MKRHFRETLSFYALAGAINYFFFPQDPAFISFTLHPFLFATILFAIRYGIWEGLVSAVLGSGLLIWATIRQNTMLEMEILYGLEHLALPILIIVLGIIVGEITESRLKKAQYYQGALKREISSNLSKTKANMGLTESLLQLEKKLAGHSLGIRDFSEQLSRMMRMDREKIYHFIPGCLAKFLSVKKSIVLVSNPNVYSQDLIKPPELDISKEELAQLRSSPVYLEAITKKKTVSLTDVLEDFDSDDFLQAPIYYAGCVLNEEGNIDAVVLVLSIPFIQFNITNLRLFEVILKTAGMVIQNQEAYQRLLDSSPYHPRWLVERAHYFFRQLPDQFLFSQHQTRQLLLAGFEFSDHTNENMQDGFMTVLSQLCIKTGARVGHLEKSNIFTLIHPQHTASDLAIDLQQRFATYGFSMSFAQLRLVPVDVSEELLSRELGHWAQHCEQAFAGVHA